MNRVLAAIVTATIVMQVGCSAKYVKHAATSVTVQIRDADTGGELNDVLLVTVYKETPEFTRDDIAGPQHPQFETVSVDLVEVSSGVQLRQKEVVRKETRTSGGVRTSYTRVDYHFVKAGYDVSTLTDDLVAGFAEMGNPAIIMLKKWQAETSDVDAIVTAEHFHCRVLPFVKADGPLRQRLVDVLVAHLDLVDGSQTAREEAERLRGILHQDAVKP